MTHSDATLVAWTRNHAEEIIAALDAAHRGSVPSASNASDAGARDVARRLPLSNSNHCCTCDDCEAPHGNVQVLCVNHLREIYPDDTREQG